jgi:hypothetical protein
LQTTLYGDKHGTAFADCNCSEKQSRCNSTGATMRAAMIETNVMIIRPPFYLLHPVPPLDVNY